MYFSPPHCPNEECPCHDHPQGGFHIKKGYYRTAHNGQKVPRYRCRHCGRYFSPNSFKSTAGQHRPELNDLLHKLLVSGVSMRRAALIADCSKRTVDRKLKWLAERARTAHAAALADPDNHTSYIQVDELETYMHTQCKPLSVPMAVRVKTGFILSFGVARMPAKGPLAAMGKSAYQWTVDDRPFAFNRMLADLTPAVKASVEFKCDGNRNYPRWIRARHPNAGITKVKGNKGKTYGGRKPFDPLFAINNTFAKLRNDLARLGRKSWTTTKSIGGLTNHLWLYVAWNNGYRLG